MSLFDRQETTQRRKTRELSEVTQRANKIPKIDLVKGLCTWPTAPVGCRLMIVLARDLWRDVRNLRYKIPAIQRERRCWVMSDL
jgi:hypothetical protein